MHMVRREPRRGVAWLEHAREAGLTAEGRERHAVHVAGRRRVGRVEVRVGIEPQHEEFAPGRAAMAGDAVDRAHGQAVIAAEHDREFAGLHAVVDPPTDDRRPGRHLAEVAQGRHGVDRVQADRAGREVAVVDDAATEVFERGRDAGGPQRRRPHQAPRLTRAGLDRNAEQGHGPVRRDGCFRMNVAHGSMGKDRPRFPARASFYRIEAWLSAAGHELECRGGTRVGRR